jgi:hypothetical protein
MYGRDFSRGHFNQHTVVGGEVRIGPLEWPFQGLGWRDHSWGPRYWTNIFAYRLFLATFAAVSGLMLLKIYAPHGSARSEGALLIDGHYPAVMDLNVITDWDARKDPRAARIGVRTASASHLIEARRASLAPLRNRRREGGRERISRIAEASTVFRWDGLEARGLASGLYQLIVY